MTVTKPNSKKKFRTNPDIFDDIAATGMQIYGDIYAVPSAVLDQTIKTGLQFKDAVKGKVKHLVKRNSWDGDESDIRRDLLFAASRSRNTEELARIHKWATGKRDGELQQVVEARAAELRIPVAQLKQGYPRGWNPQMTDRALRYNPGKKSHGATSVSQWITAVMSMKGMSRQMPKDVAREMVRATPPARRSEFARQIGRRNPENLAAHFYEKFHGEPSEEEIVIEQELHEHEHLGVIGTLAACVVDTPTGLRATLNFDSDDGKQVPWLCASEDGEQLFIEGGYQEIDLKTLKMNGPEWRKERMVIGQFSPPETGRPWNLAYVTQKSFDDFETIRYEHDLGEPNEGEPKSQRRQSPILEYDTVNHLLFIVGGQYKIKLPVIGVSAGIEN